VTLFATGLAQELPGVRTVVRTLDVAGLRIPHRALGVARAYRYHDRRAAQALRRSNGRFDLVHCWPKASIETCTAASDLGIPTVREVPNTHTAYAFETVARELAKLGLDPVERHSHTFDSEVLAQEEAEYRLADVLLVPSEFSRRTFLERGFSRDRLALHQYGFDPRRFYPRSEARLHSASDPLTAVFVGRCEPRKGLHYALQAWVGSGAAERGRFVICGDFVPGYREALARLLEHPSVEVRGFVADPAAVMRESDVLVLPSLEEGSAVVTYEAQASGCVLLVSNATGARCEHPRQGLIHHAGDVEGLTEHLRLLAEDRELLHRLRTETLAARDRLTWDYAGEQLASVYEAVVDPLVDSRASAAFLRS